MNPFQYIFYKDPAFYFFVLGSLFGVWGVWGNKEAMVWLLIFYWFESVLMTLVALLKMSLAKKPMIPGTQGMKIGDFAFMAALFLFLHAIMLFFIARELYKFDITHLVIPSIVLFVSFTLLLGRYVIDIARFFLRKEYLEITSAEAQGFTFLRIIVFHISGVFGLVLRFIPFAVIFFPLKWLAEFLEFLVGRTSLSKRS